ncbi:MAG: tetratricopeptide repeat protein [Planctomycetes bacterium]|nr:tetratricopeptide repeat protein [Planctomycetota bacterium]
MDAERAYLFRHTVLRDTAYELQLPTVRARLHALVVDSFEALNGGPPPPVSFKLGEDLEAEAHPLDPLAAELAEHALKGQVLTSNLRELRRRQEHYLLRAVWNAERSYDNAAALELWSRLADIGRLDRDASREAAYLGHASAAAVLAGNPNLAEQLARRAIDAAGADASVLLRGVLIGRLGRAERELGRPVDSIANMRESVALLVEAGAHKLALGVEMSIAIALREIGETGEAEAINDKIASAARKAGAMRLVGNAIGNQVGVYVQTGRAQRALEAAQESLVIHRQIGNRRSEGITLGNLASLQRAAGDYEEAEKSFALALEINREVGDRNSEGRALANLGNLHVARNRPEQAESCFRQSIAILRELGIRRDEAVALGNYATFLTHIGRLSEAESAFLRALDLHRAVGNKRHEGAHRMDFAACLLATGRQPEAAAAWRQGANQIRELGDPDLFAEKAGEMRAFCEKAGVEPFE